MRVIVIAGVASAFALGACGGHNPSIVTDHDPEWSFDAFHTFDLLDGGSGLEEDRIDVEELDGFIETAIVTALTNEGFERVTDGTADFMVGYHMATDGALSVRRMNTGYQYSAGWGWNNWGMGFGPTLDPGPGRGGSQEYRQYYDEGWIVLDVMDRESRRLVYRAAAHGEVDMNAAPNVRRHRVERIVRQLFDDFPP